MSIVFGTDGWRGIIARDFTYHNLTLVACATANYIRRNGDKNTSVVIGYDTRFMSKDFAEETARILASYGIIVHLTQNISSTPQVSFHTKQKGAALGIVITASHNPPSYSGFKVKGRFGGPAYPEEIAEIEKELAKLGGQIPPLELKSLDDYIQNRMIRPFDALESYLRYLRKKIDLELINTSGYKVLFDAMYGAGLNTMPRIVQNVEEIHAEINPSFGEVGHPEPIPHNLHTMIEKMKTGAYSIGIATDGDADRLGAIDETGAFVDSQRIFMLLLKYLYEDKKKRGAVVKTVSITSMVEKYCTKHGITLHETPVGFKHVAKMMNESKILVGGEESGGLGTMLHIPERDGIFNALLLMEMMATRKKTLRQLCEELDAEFGPHRFLRRDVHVTEQQKKAILNACAQGPARLGRYPVTSTETRDGYKFFVENGWLLIRASGTEPLIRFYAEAESIGKVNELLEEGLKLS
jgi:phosphomannomutase